MGKHSVIFHAFLACLVPLADAIGVAPSGLSSPDFYRSRRFRTTNSTPLGASIHNSASAESAVAILDDLSRKSRVMLAHRKDGEKNKLLTWNAGGGVPTPEYLGGEWEEEYDKMYSDIEKMTGVLLFVVSGCDEATSNEAGMGRYEPRYKAMRDLYLDLIKKEGNEALKIDVDTFAKQTLGHLLDGIVDDTETLPDWTKGCTFPAAIGNMLKLCPKRKVVEKDPCLKDTGTKATMFSLGFEGCWKKRGALPVYGARFFDLYALRTENKKEYWKEYVKGLQAQDAVPGKGCKPGEGFPMKTGKPGKHVDRQNEEDVEYEDKTKVKTPFAFTKEVWSMTGAWDTLIMDLTALSIKILNTRGGDSKLISVEKEGKYKAITVIDDAIGSKTITQIVKGAQDFLHPDVVFLQEADMVNPTDPTLSSSYDSKSAVLDTAIYVSQEFGGGIDDEASDALQGAWDKMMDTMKATIENERDKTMMKDLSLGEDAAALEAMKKSKDETEKQKYTDAVDAAWKKIPYNSVPEPLLALLPKVHEKKWGEKLIDDPNWKKPEDDKNAKAPQVLKRVANHGIQRASFDGLMADKKGLGYTQAPHLVTVAVTAEEPKVLLLSIHSDGDGYYVAQYLNLAVKFFKHFQAKSTLARMYIGMDANVQPPPGHASHEPKKGYTYEQLEQVLPESVKMLDPKVETVKKVRTFLQTQFAKIGKDDEEKKDLLFVYPDVTEYQTIVYNKYDKEKNTLIVKPIPEITKKEEEKKQTETPIYYPKNEWPVDHFMSYATVTPGKDVQKAKTVTGKICKVLKRTVRKTKYNVKSCISKLWKKKEGDKAEVDSEWTRTAKLLGEDAVSALKKEDPVVKKV